MNVFVLNTGRCGSTTFIHACRHIRNFTCGHETRAHLLGRDRFDYPPNHIEADNRLSWFLGKLDRYYGARAAYVHLTRRQEATARSFVNRFSTGIIAAYRSTIVMGAPRDADPLVVASDYCETVTANIELFLKDKPRVMSFALETAKPDFERFWQFIGAEGDLTAALAEFDTPRNASAPVEGVVARLQMLRGRVSRALRTLAGQ